MIVSCPACQTRYLVDEAQLGGGAGRRVRCASCGHLWHYSAEAAAIHLAVAAITAELAAQTAGVPAAAATLPSNTPPAPALRAEPGTQAPPLPPAVAPLARPTVMPPPVVIGARRPAGGAWLAALALAAVLLMIVILGRNKLVAVYPPFAQLYQKLHLAAPTPPGLRITSTISRDADSLTVAGDIANDSREPQPLARLRVTLEDGAKHALETRIIDPPIARLPPGLTTHYSATFERPSITAVGADVAFATD